MSKNLPFLAAIVLLLGTLILFPGHHGGQMTRNDNDSAPPSRSGTLARLEGGLQERVSSDEFAAIPRGYRETRRFRTSRTYGGLIEATPPAGSTTGQPAKVGHHFIPPEIRRLSNDELRERLPDEMRTRLVRYERDLEQLDPEFRRYFCWGPDTAPEVVEAFRRAEIAGGLGPGETRTLAFRFIGGGHWSRTATDGSGVGTQGRPVTVTWSLVPDGTIVPSGDSDPAGESNLIEWLDGLYPGTITSDLTQRAWFPLIQESMDNLAAQSGLNLVYEPNDDGVQFTSFSSGQGVLGTRGDIRISGRDIDGNSGVLAFAYSPDYGDIVIETFDSFYNTTTNNSRRFVNVLTHEAGHAVGLGHVCPVDQTKLMEPFINLGFRGAQFDETYSLQRQYADELEVHPGFNDNDSVANATPVALDSGVVTAWKYLSIDDSTDVDYLAFPAAAGQTVTVRVIPSDPIAPSDPDTDTYLEGAQNSDGSCSSGTPFDPTSQQNLTVEVLDTNGSTVLGLANSQPAGETEELVDVLLPSSGTYFLRINGGSADSSQLYELQAELITPDPSPLIEVASSRIISESNSGANGAADPGETLLFGVTVNNIGELAASDLSATLSGPAGFTAFDTTDGVATLGPAASTELVFVFSPGGSCGDTLDLSLALTDSGGYADTLTIPLTLGVPTQAPSIDEGFDGSSTLPGSWTTSTSGGGSPWLVSSPGADSTPNAAFSPGVGSVSDAFLISPSVVVGDDNPTLTFRHSFDTENSRDGGVLEYRLGTNDWADLPGSAATVTAGDYNGSVGQTGRPQDKAPIDGRNAWTGNSGGFITTSIDLPSAWAGQTIQFRWRLSHNSGTAGTGWSVDSVNLSGAQIFVCDSFRPSVSLTSSGTTLAEGDAGSTVDLTLSTPLPLVSDLPVTPEISGSADVSDLTAAPSFTILSGDTSDVVTISAAGDGSSEGTEQITFTLPASEAGYAAVAPSSVSIDIEEGVIAANVVLSNLTTTYTGSPQGATVTTDPSGLATEVTYNGSTSLPTNAGSYDVTAVITEPGYTGGTTGTLVINPAAATVTLGNLTTTYDGTPKPATVSTNPPGLPTSTNYNGSPTVPTDAGSYIVFAAVTDANYIGSSSDTLTISPATATVSLSGLDKTYDGSPQGATVTTDPAGISTSVTYDGSLTLPTDAGSYAVSATITDANYVGDGSGTLTISPAAATVTLTNLSKTYDGSPQGATVTTDPASLPVDVTYDGLATVPTDAGTYAVSASVTDANYTGSANDSLVIAKATAVITLDGLDVLYDGLPKPITSTTDPTGLTVLVTYNGSGTAPAAVGSYTVAASIDEPNYEGAAGGTLNIGASFLSWEESFALTSSDPFADEDGDGWPAVAEYLFDTNPGDKLSAPTLETAIDATTFSLVTPPPVTRPDATLSGETSDDLQTWTADGVTPTGTGFAVQRTGPTGYLRLRFSYDAASE